jgi:hypothetical protein
MFQWHIGRQNPRQLFLRENYAVFFTAFTFAHRAFCAAAILLRAAQVLHRTLCNDRHLRATIMQAPLA